MTRRIVPLGKLLRDWIYFNCPVDDDRYYIPTINLILSFTPKTFTSIT